MGRVSVNSRGIATDTHIVIGAERETVSQATPPMSVNHGQRRRRRVRIGQRGFTLLEVVIGIAMLLMLIVSAIGAITLLDRASRSQAEDTTALEIAQGKLEEFQATKYNPPVSPFVSSATWTTNQIILALNKTGTNTRAAGLLISKVEPVANGHLVTVSVKFTNMNVTPVTAQLQTLINHHSPGQPP
jgi:type II secretory pathway pseudopilin PulG